MYRIKSIIFTGLIMGFLFAGVKSGNAQETDFGAWVALDIKKDITRKFSLELGGSQGFQGFWGIRPGVDLTLC
ncbi:MAG TPA: hypothetical protein PLX49_03765 [Prolixibacteraceae bacterium]|nr:hypothetical protein [Prolixibacteraceae bacterium]